MLQRPEILTREHIVLWLASKPADETYDWMLADEGCPCAIYTREHGLAHWSRCSELINDVPGAPSLNKLARDGEKSWGSLYERAREAWRRL
jgi:hypothetical protein